MFWLSYHRLINSIIKKKSPDCFHFIKLIQKCNLVLLYSFLLMSVPLSLWMRWSFMHNLIKINYFHLVIATLVQSGASLESETFCMNKIWKTARKLMQLRKWKKCQKCKNLVRNTFGTGWEVYTDLCFTDLIGINFSLWKFPS